MADTFDNDGNLVGDQSRSVIVNQRSRRGERVALTFPYRVWPEVQQLPALEDRPDADELALTPTPFAFDSSKPTIDQTRKDAIDSIRSNFQNLPTTVPGGATAQVQFNDAGIFNGDAGLTYNKATDTLTVAGQFVTNGIAAQSIVVTPGGISVSGGGSGAFIGSTGDIAQAAGASKLEVRSAGGTHAAYMTFHRPGGYAAQFGLDTDNQWKVGGYSYGAVSYALLHAGNSFTFEAGGYHLNAAARNIRTTGYVLGGAVIGAYSYIGAVASAALDFRLFQTFGINAGSTVASMVGTLGQVARILVNGGGAVTLPANVKWADGHPTWGTVQTIISMWTDGATFWATATPFNT